MWRIKGYAPVKEGIASGVHMGVSAPGSKREVAHWVRKESGSLREVNDLPQGIKTVGLLSDVDIRSAKIAIDGYLDNSK